MTTKTWFALIPTGAKVFAALAFFACIAAGIGYYCFLSGRWSMMPGVLLGFGAGLFAAAYVLLAGYVCGDARRRGMPPVPWTALAVLVPNCLGFVLYFLLRKPILTHCTNCGSGIAGDSAFCPRCGHPQLSTAA